MDDLELLLAHNVFINKGAYAILLGSGTSSSAGILTGWQILIALIERLSTLERNPIDNEDAENWYKKKYQSEPNYSKLIEVLAPQKEERVNLLKPFFEINNSEDEEADLKKPTIAHKAIAKLIKKGYIRVIITTNFDRLMENALKIEGIEATVISHPNHIDNVMPLIHSDITIIKVNGDYLDTSFLNIESELDSYDERLVELLKNVFENFGLITAGWSAKWDSGLKKILETSNKFRFSNFFTHKNKCNTELQEISNLRKGRLLQIREADFFFKELLENIEALEKGQKNNPLSKSIAIERLKKYIIRQDRFIDLQELLNGALKRAIERINANVLLTSNINDIRNYIDSIIGTIDTFNALLIEGVFWGNSFFHEIWIKELSRLGHLKRQNTIYRLSDTFEFFPALLSFYAIGLTALYKKDFVLVKKLFSIEVFNPFNEYEKVNLLKYANTHIFERRQLNIIYSNNQYVPLSEILYNIFRPVFELKVVDEKEYDELFDHFELLTSLKYIDLENKNGILPGRYVHTRRNSNNIIYKKFTELENQKENLDWITERIFKDFSTLKDIYLYFNVNVKQEGIN